MLRLSQVISVLKDTKAVAREAVEGELTQVKNSFGHKAVRSKKTEYGYSIEALFPDGEWGHIDNLSMGLASSMAELSRLTGDDYEITIGTAEAKLTKAGVEIKDGKVKVSDLDKAIATLSAEATTIVPCLFYEADEELEQELANVDPDEIFEGHEPFWRFVKLAKERKAITAVWDGDQYKMFFNEPDKL